jgi:hypothetical protein
MSHSATEDYTTLPAALLPFAKQHMRVDFTDDDVAIAKYIGWAIDYCQTFWDLQVFGATVAWLPTVNGASRYQCPVSPVSSFIVMSDAIDVSTEYALEATAITAPVWLVHSDGTPFHSDAVVTLTTGYANAASLPPKMEADIMRVAATLYENRESIAAISLDQIPFWLNDMMGGLWVPRA